MVTLTPEEEAILRPEYDKYCSAHHRWHWKAPLLNFNDWWRTTADELKERSKYE